MADFATFRIKLKDFVSPQLQKIRGRFKGAEKSINSFEKNSNRGIKKTGSSLSQLNNIGRLGNAKNGMAAFSNLTRLAAGGMNPLIVGLGLAAVGAFKLGGALLESSKQLQTNLQVTNQLLGGTQQETKKITAEATALSKVYGDDYTKTIQTASKLTQQFGISNLQAFDLIKKGYASGTNLGGDMLDTLEESAFAFKNLGATADQQMAILQQSVSKGIKDTPKLLESFNKNLPNLGGDVGRLLDKNFGPNFSNQLKKNLASGEATAIDALKAISTAVGNTTFASGATESLAEQIFGDRSGSAVALLNNFAAFDTNLDNLVSKNTQFNQSKNQQLQLEKQLAATQLQSSKQIDGLANKFKVFGLKMKISLFQGLTGFLKIAKGAFDFGMAVFNLGAKLSSLLGITKLISTAFWGIGKAIEGITWLIGKFVGGVTQGLNGLSSLIGETKDVSNIKTPSNAQKFKDLQSKPVQSDLANIPGGILQLKVDSKKIGTDIGNAQGKTFDKTNKQLKTEDLFKTTAKPSLTPEAKSQLTGGVNSIVAGGKQVRNVSVTVEKMVGIENLISNVKEAASDVERELNDIFIKVLQGAEVALNKG